MSEKEEITKLKLAQQNNEILSQLCDKLKIIKHDLKNDYTLIDYYLDNQDLDKIKFLLNQYTQTLSNIPVFINSNNKLLNTIINNKIIEATIKNIQINCIINVPNYIPINDYTLNNLLSNILNNAIENCPNQGIIQIEIQYLNDLLHIKVSNSIDYTFNPKLQTNKKHKANHGYGLRSIHKIINQYNGYINIEYTDILFTLQASLHLN